MSSLAEKNAKPGYRTSEFWLTLAAIIVSSIMSVGLFDETSTEGKVIAVIASSLVALGYTTSRTILKR